MPRVTTWAIEPPDCVRSICGDGDAGLLRLRESEPLVYSRVRGRLHPGIGVWLSPRSLAVWRRRIRLVGCGDSALVGGNVKITNASAGWKSANPAPAEGAGLRCFPEDYPPQGPPV